jgi:hypothetical protein
MKKRLSGSLVILLMILAACTRQEVIDSTGAGMKNMCKNARNCTVYDDNAAAR